MPQSSSVPALALEIPRVLISVALPRGAIASPRSSQKESRGSRESRRLLSLPALAPPRHHGGVAAARRKLATPGGGRHGGGWRAMEGAEHRPWIRLPCPRPRQGVFHDGELDLAIGRCRGAETGRQGPGAGLTAAWMAAGRPYHHRGDEPSVHPLPVMPPASLFLLSHSSSQAGVQGGDALVAAV